MKQLKASLISLHKRLINQPTSAFHNTNTVIKCFSTMLQLHFYVIFTSFMKGSLKSSRNEVSFDYTKACSYVTGLSYVGLTLDVQK